MRNWYLTTNQYYQVKLETKSSMKTIKILKFSTVKKLKQFSQKKRNSAFFSNCDVCMSNAFKNINVLILSFNHSCFVRVSDESSS